MVLHTLNTAPGSAAFSDCLRLVSEGDAIVLLGDGVYAAIAGSEACAALQKTPARITVLDTDCAAAGIEAPAFPAIDMDGLVGLTEYYPRQLAWY